jgi:hypothetical protein
VTQAIGTLNEKPLHAALKQWYAEPDDLIEASVDGFMIDIVRGDLLIEIQTSNVAGIRQKLTRLVGRHPVRLVCPITKEKWIVRQTRSGDRILSRRKSPRRGSLDSVFEEFVSVASLLANPHFSLQVLFIQEEEIRRPDSTRNWRRKGWKTFERRLLKVLAERLFEQPQDVLDLLPDSLSEPFTTADLVVKTGRPLWLAQKMAYCLRTMGAIEAVGKQGRSILYVRKSP